MTSCLLFAAAAAAAAAASAQVGSIGAGRIGAAYARVMAGNHIRHVACCLLLLLHMCRWASLALGALAPRCAHDGGGPSSLLFASAAASAQVGIIGAGCIGAAYARMTRCKS
jgi:lactate dehydrogenase-like 2-hydroxyacid dehydrogenase